MVCSCDGDRVSWWRHQMETFAALLALCAGNSPITGEFPPQRPVTRWLRRHSAHYAVIVMWCHTCLPQNWYNGFRALLQRHPAGLTNVFFFLEEIDEAIDLESIELQILILIPQLLNSKLHCLWHSIPHLLVMLRPFCCKKSSTSIQTRHLLEWNRSCNLVHFIWQTLESLCFELCFWVR